MGRPSNVVYLDDYRARKELERNAGTELEGGVTLTRHQMRMQPYHNALRFVSKKFARGAYIDEHTLVLLSILQLVSQEQKEEVLVSLESIDDVSPHPAGFDHIVLPSYSDFRGEDDLVVILNEMHAAGMVILRMVETGEPDDEDYRIDTLVTPRPGKIMRSFKPHIAEQFYKPKRLKKNEVFRNTLVPYDHGIEAFYEDNGKK